MYSYEERVRAVELYLKLGKLIRIYTVELYAQVRRSVLIDGLSQREAAFHFGLSRNTISKMLRHSLPRLCCTNLSLKVYTIIFK